MKKALLYLLLFSYTTVVLKPVFPTIADTVAHIFWYSEHMATVHFENGRYHVHLEYQQAAKNTVPGKDAAMLKTSSTADHINAVCSYVIHCYSGINAVFPTFCSSLSSASRTNVYPPPRI